MIQEFVVATVLPSRILGTSMVTGQGSASRAKRRDYRQCV